MARMLVIGIGSLLMTDDGVGVKVAGSVKNRLQEHGIAVLIGETDVQYCLNEIRPDDFLIIIDAVMQANEPGSITAMPLRDSANTSGKLYSQHDFSLMDAVLLKYPDIQGCFIGIGAAEIGYGFELSNVLKERFGQICEKVLDTIFEFKGK